MSPIGPKPTCKKRLKMSACCVPAQPVDATLYLRWKDGVYSVISEESRLSVSSQAHLKEVVRQLNERPRINWKLNAVQPCAICWERLNLIKIQFQSLRPRPLGG